MSAGASGCYAMIAAYSASVLLFFVYARYRFALVPFLVLFASAGAHQVGQTYSRWRCGCPALGKATADALAVARTCKR